MPEIDIQEWIKNQLGLTDADIEALKTDAGKRCGVYAQLVRWGMDPKYASSIAFLGICQRQTIPWIHYALAFGTGFLLAKLWR